MAQLMRSGLDSLASCMPRQGDEPRPSGASGRKHDSEPWASLDAGQHVPSQSREACSPDGAPVKAGPSGQAHSPEQAQGMPAAAAATQQKAEKWKARCHELQREISALSAGAAAREAALTVSFSMIVALGLDYQESSRMSQ